MRVRAKAMARGPVEGNLACVHRAPAAFDAAAAAAWTWRPQYRGPS